MLGKKASPSKVIILGLMKGMRALDMTLKPWDSSTMSSTTSVCKPVLAKSVLTVWTVLWIIELPLWKLLDDDATTPLHWVSHEFQTVPIEFLFSARTVS